MTAIEYAIREAAEKGGWADATVFDYKFIRDGFIETVLGDFDDELAERNKLSLAEIFLDPLFWQALGKARGWVGEKIRMCVGCGVALKWNEQPDMEGRHNLQRNGKQVGCGSDIIEYEGQWLIEWHRFIDHLAEGKGAESFFATL